MPKYYEADKGDTIWHFSSKLIKAANELQQTRAVEGVFNDIVIKAYAGSLREDIVEKYELLCRLRQCRKE